MNAYPYATKMLNIGRHGYMGLITAALAKIDETRPFLSDDNHQIRAGAEELVEELEAIIASTESDAEERFQDWATD